MKEIKLGPLNPLTSKKVPSPFFILNVVFPDPLCDPPGFCTLYKYVLVVVVKLKLGVACSCNIALNDSPLAISNDESVVVLP